ncbi:MAG: thiolase family protein, partial [Chloroflexota bacterium]|nr:thiolase family protein [Chloroflexota bacterium]
MTLKGKAAIIGIGELKPTRTPEGKTSLGIMAEVAKLAIEDAGLRLPDIDGVLLAAPMQEAGAIWPSIVSEYLQLRPTYANVVDLGGASACGMVWRAAAAIAQGFCHTVLCLTGEATDVEAFYAPRGGRPSTLPWREFEVPYGPMGANSGYALVAQRHMYEYGTTSRQMAKIAVDQRTNACANPDALFYGRPISLDDVLNSPLIVDPLHLLEIVMPCTGGAALVVTAADRAKEGPHPPVYLLGAAEALTHSLIACAPNLTTSPIAVTAPRAFEMAGVSPKDIDLVSVYDCYTITVLVTLEDAGFCPKGRGGPFVEENDLTYKGN